MRVYIIKWENVMHTSYDNFITKMMIIINNLIFYNGSFVFVQVNILIIRVFRIQIEPIKLTGLI